MYEVIFNVKGYPQAVTVYADSSDASTPLVDELTSKINNGEYSLSIEDAFDEYPEDCDLVIGFRRVGEDGVSEPSYTFYNEREMDHIKNIIIKAFGEM